MPEVDRTLIAHKAGFEQPGLENKTGLGGPPILIAIGAILRWAITATTSGVNIHTVGLILLIVGAIGFVISLLGMAFYADRTTRPRYTDSNRGGSDGYPQPRA
ncbi:MAG: hypothetical protein KGL15_07915 [Acidobacteriota bacterium]|nr:hypothetical protein [Acidobacteriota bacterium]